MSAGEGYSGIGISGIADVRPFQGVKPLKVEKVNFTPYESIDFIQPIQCTHFLSLNHAIIGTWNEDIRPRTL